MYKYVLCGYCKYGWNFVHKLFLIEKLKNGCTLFQRKVPNGVILGIFLSFLGIKPDLEGTPHGLFIIKYFIVQIKFGI